MEDSKLNPEENNSIESSPNLNEDNKDLNEGNKKEENVVDPSYSDPVGPSISMRPRTAKNKNLALAAMQDDIHDFEADDFLPD